MNLKFESKLILGLSLMALSMTPSYAGFTAFTMHSRANCGGFNESISWHWNNPRYLMTFSQHYDNGRLNCDLSDHWRLTWRSDAFHFAEGYNGAWFVQGQHWGLNRNSDPVKLTDSQAVDCRFYDGWWDK